MSASQEKDIVIIGGGIIGCTSAYFLSRHPSYNPSNHRITVLEATKIAGGASGKAGGLLGLWAYPSCIVPLSFRLHEELAKEHGGEARWGYRKISCGSVDATGRMPQVKSDVETKESAEALSLHKKDGLKLVKNKAPRDLPDDLNWIAEGCAPQYTAMGSPKDTAQVHPYQFTTAMAELAQDAGVKVVYGSALDVKTEGDKVAAVKYIDKGTSEKQSIKATDVIIAAGPWTSRIFPEAGIEAIRAHSVTIRPSNPISGYALFTSIDLPVGFGQARDSKPGKGHSQTVSPEIYARPNNEAYACGAGDSTVPLPKTTADVETDMSRCQDLIDQVSSISDELRDGEVLVKQACYLPLGGPLIGSTRVRGLLLAAGHTCWGIQNGPATGKLVSELVFDGRAKSANISSLDPNLA